MVIIDWRLFHGNRQKKKYPKDHQFKIYLTNLPIYHRTLKHIWSKKDKKKKWSIFVRNWLKTTTETDNIISIRNWRWGTHIFLSSLINCSNNLLCTVHGLPGIWHNNQQNWAMQCLKLYYIILRCRKEKAHSIESCFYPPWVECAWKCCQQLANWSCMRITLTQHMLKWDCVNLVVSYAFIYQIAYIY